MDANSPNSEENVNESRAKKVNTESEDSLSSKPDGWGTRHTLIHLGFWGCAVSYAMRVNLSIAIVAMVSSKSLTSHSANFSDACPNLLHPSQTQTLHNGMTLLNETSSENEGEFNWDGVDQGIILGAFYWGYLVTQVPGGMLAERIGGKWPFGVGVLVTAIFSLLTPWAARTGKGALIAVRVIQGLGEGVSTPSMHALLARWIPPLERSKMGALVYTGAQMGTVLAMPLCGFLISSGFMGGWPSVFYVIGIAGIFWCVLWNIFVFNSPALHPGIGARELSYIQNSIGSQTSNHRVSTPWRKIFTSMPVLAILVAQTGQSWGLYTLLTELPTYMKTILHFDISTNGWLSALPYLSMWIFSVASSWYADYLRENNLSSTTAVRKIFNSIAHIIPAIALVGASYSGCDRFLTVMLLTLAVGINGAVYSGHHINHLDIAPNYAGVLMGITNGFSNLCGIIAPYVAGVIIKDRGSLADWRLIFFISAIIYVVDNTFYVIFASGEEQPWNRDLSKEDLKSGGVLTHEHDPLLSSSSD